MFQVNNPRHKVLLGYLIIFFAGFFVFLLSFAFVITLFDPSRDFRALVSLVIPIFIFVFVLGYGIRLKRQAKQQLEPVMVIIDPSIKLSISSHLSLSLYKKIALELSYKTPVLVYLFIIGVGLTISFCVNDRASELLIIGGAFFIITSFNGYILAAKNFNSNKMLHEKALFEIDAKEVKVTGETYSSKVEWSSLLKVQELSEAYLIYTSSKTAFFLCKENMKSSDHETFKEIVMAQQLVIKEFNRKGSRANQLEEV